MKKRMFVLLISIIVTVFAQNVYSQEYMYTIQNPTMMREKPVTDATILNEIPKGEKLIVLVKEDPWIKVMYNDKIGYVELGHVTSSAPEEEAKTIDFLDIRTQYKQNKETMTKIKFQAWWKELKSSIENKRITSQGYVDTAKETWTGKLIIRLDVDVPSEGVSAYDIELQMDPVKDKEIATQLDKDEILSFTGKVTLFDIMLGGLIVNVEDVTILSHKKSQ